MVSKSGAARSARIQQGDDQEMAEFRIGLTRGTRPGLNHVVGSIPRWDTTG